MSTTQLVKLYCATRNLAGEYLAEAYRLDEAFLQIADPRAVQGGSRCPDAAALSDMGRGLDQIAQQLRDHFDLWLMPRRRSNPTTFDVFALWPDGYMCPRDEIEETMRPPFARSDDYELVDVLSYDGTGTPDVWVKDAEQLLNVSGAERIVHVDTDCLGAVVAYEDGSVSAFEYHQNVWSPCEGGPPHDAATATGMYD